MSHDLVSEMPGFGFRVLSFEVLFSNFGVLVSGIGFRIQTSAPEVRVGGVCGDVESSAKHPKI